MQNLTNKLVCETRELVSPGATPSRDLEVVELHLSFPVQRFKHQEAVGWLAYIFIFVKAKAQRC